MCLAQGPQRSDADEARTRGPSVSSQALYQCVPYSLLLLAVKGKPNKRIHHMSFYLFNTA